MRNDEASGTTEAIMAVDDLRGRSVWTDDGERLGTIRSVHCDEDGRITAFDVRERWILGPHHTIGAQGMRLDNGDVVVPISAVVEMETREATGGGTPSATREHRVSAEVPPIAAPAFVTGRAGASMRFGGFDVVGSFFGGLVVVASVVLIGGVLAAVFDTSAVNIDTSLNSIDAVTSSTLLVGAATLLLASFLGGWAAGRSSRFAGVGNGVGAVIWALLLGIGFGVLGWAFGNNYDVYAHTDLPKFTTDEFATWGLVAFAVALLLMLVGGALGGGLGEMWHRRVDRMMLEPVSIGGHSRDDALAPDSADAVPSGLSERASDVRIRGLDE